MSEGINEIELEHFKAQVASVLEGQKGTMAFEHAAMKPGFYLNGGAVVVYTTLLGALEKMPDDPSAPIIAWALGLGFAFFATMLGHESQLNFYRAGNQSVLATIHEHTDDLAEGLECRADAGTFEKLAKNQRGQWQALLLLSTLMFLLGAFSAVAALPQ